MGYAGVEGCNHWICQKGGLTDPRGVAHQQAWILQQGGEACSPTREQPGMVQVPTEESQHSQYPVQSKTFNKQGPRLPQTTKSEDQPETVLFVPHTPGGALKKDLQKVQDQLNRGKKFQGVRIVERMGPKVGSLVAIPAPWRKDPCPNEDCTPCTVKPSSCRTRNCT